MFINNKIYLCLINANQPTACSELLKNFQEVRYRRLLIEMR